MRCPCDAHQAEADGRYVRRIERGWPRWLAYLLSPPASGNYERAKEFAAEYRAAEREGRVIAGLLGAFITDEPVRADG